MHIKSAYVHLHPLRNFVFSIFDSEYYFIFTGIQLGQNVTSRFFPTIGHESYFCLQGHYRGRCPLVDRIYCDYPISESTYVNKN